MTVPPLPSQAPDTPPPPFRELSRTFWRGVSSTHSLGPAIEGVLHEFNAHVGTRRTSVWLHDRRARQLALFASSDPIYGASPARIGIADPQMPAARGLRLEHAQLLEDGPEPVVVSPLRGWRRALGTLVVEGPSAPGLDEEDRLALANELGRQLSAGIENVQLLEDMLRQRRLLEDTFNSLLDPVVVTDRALRVVQMNDAFAMRLGRSRTDLVDRNLSELVGEELAEWAAGVEQLKEPATEAVERTRTIEHAQFGGIFAMNAMPLINEDGEPVGIVLAARDITRQTRLEAEKEALRTKLAQTEKLASLGQFVAGIAHEINNPLQGVLGHLELLMTAKPGTPSTLPKELRKDLRVIFREADRAAKIVRNLLTFTGSHRKTRQRLRMERVLTRALLSRRAALARAQIEVVREHADDLPSILGDAVLLQQAFLNVLLNAEHAIAATERPGTITIATTQRGGRLITSIRDTGGGIPADVLPRIFDPFFTTKDVGQGAGLGLAITYGIIQEHGGTISAANAPEGGAIVTIELPAAPADADQPG
jgi:PAS domain S-box-containing protein